MAGTCNGGVALVTGGGAGIGRGIACLFAREGAKVVVVDLNGEGAKQTVEAIVAQGGEAAAHVADVADEDAVVAMIERTVELYGRLDYAANNAGVSDTKQTFHEMSLESWDRMIRANLTSVFLCLKHEIQQMLGQEPIGERRGAIVNTASAAAIIPAPGLPHYSAAKHGVVGLTRNAAQGYAREGIRVNAILPGITKTAMTKDFFEDNPDAANAAMHLLPRQRGGTPDEVAEAAVWLCSDSGRWVSGQSLVVDGGGVYH